MATITPTAATAIKPALTLKKAAEYLQMSPNNLRRIVKTGNSPIVVEEREVPGTDVTYTLYVTESLDAYKVFAAAAAANKTPRAARKTAGIVNRVFKLRLTADQAVKYNEWAQANEMPALDTASRPVNEEQKAKRKAYNVDRNAKKKAERDAALAERMANDPEFAAAQTAKLAARAENATKRASRKSRKATAAAAPAATTTEQPAAE